MTVIKDWPRAFQSFVLITRLSSYKVTVDHIQIGTLNISRNLGVHDNSWQYLCSQVFHNPSGYPSDLAEQENYRPQADQVHINQDHIFNCPVGQ